MEKAIILFVISSCLLSSSNHFSCGEKILFYFGGGSYSHKDSVWPWASELANKGHEVTFLSAYEKQPAEQKNIKDLASKTLHKLMSKTFDVDRFQEREDGKEQGILSSYTKTSITICQSLFESTGDPVLQHLIHNSTFDLVIVNIIFGECGFILANAYKAKTIVFDASVPLSWFYEIYGIQLESSWIPDILYKYDNFPLTFTERFTNTLLPLYWYWDRYNYMYPALENVMKKAFNLENVPSFLEMEKNASLIVVNSHPASDFAYSLPPFIIQTGGLQSWLPEKAIPQKYQKFMDEAGPDGVTLISFGSTIDLENVSTYYIEIFFRIMKKYQNVRFLLKWSGPLPKGFENGLDNLLISDWLPQRELLRHPKLRTFITHGGLNSMQEATFYAVPLIVIPLFADQDYNAYRVEAQNLGFRLEVRDLTFEVMDKAMNRILNDAQFKKNMETKSRIFRDRPQSPLETLMYWTEFVLRHNDTSTLKPMNNHLSWFQRRLLDVYAAYMAIVVTMLFLISFVVVKIISRVFVTSINIKQKVL